jgi:dolichyl-diphosphooligosaccharide--protein glycosyltransferase
MATHDAYFGMANALGTGRVPDQSLAQILKAAQTMTGIDLGILAFWFPAFFAPLAAVPVVFLAWRWRIPEAGLTAGVLAAACTGYFLRTRLGFFDNDIGTLFFPLSFLTGLIYLFQPHIRPSWVGSSSREDESVSLAKLHRCVFQAIGVGLIGAAYIWFRSAGESFVIVFIFLCGIIALSIPDEKRLRPYLLMLLLVVYAVSLAGWIGLGLGVVLWILSRFRTDFFQHRKYVYLFLGCLIVFFFFYTELHVIILNNIHRVLGYAKMTSQEALRESAALKLPAIKQSVREAQNIPFSQIINRIAGNWFVFVPGLIGYIYLIWKRPLALLAIPLLGIALAAAKLGNRFTMYGGMPLGMGLGLGLSLLLMTYRCGRALRWGLQIVLCLAVVWPMWHLTGKLIPSPILPKVYAKTFIELKAHASPKARLWQWWDYGYAGQYYAQRATFGDGGGRFHKGPFLYPLAKVHMTHSPMQANQLIKEVSATQIQAYENNATQYATSPAMWQPYLFDPIARLRTMGPKKAQGFIDSLSNKPMSWSQDLPEQYLLFSWENLKLAYWISYYGNWNIETGKTHPGKIQMLHGSLQFDLKQGQIHQGQYHIPLDQMAIVTRQKTEKHSWHNDSGIFAVFNQLSNELYLMNKNIYESLMIQMLISEPSTFNKYFELVVDHYPWSRAYQVK